MKVFTYGNNSFMCKSTYPTRENSVLSTATKTGLDKGRLKLPLCGFLFNKGLELCCLL